MSKQWAVGDRVIHAAKPEWGTGLVNQARPEQHEGKPCQRLSVRFERAGPKTLSTAFATLRPAKHDPSVPPVAAVATASGGRTRAGVPRPASQADPRQTAPTNRGNAPAEEKGGAAPPPGEGKKAAGGTGWLDALENGNPQRKLRQLPEDVNDPFATLEERLRRTAALYRFNANGGSLLDWACVQTGMDDPLTVFSRSELEEAFAGFARQRDDHLIKLAREQHRAKPGTLKVVLQDAPAPAVALLRRVNAKR